MVILPEASVWEHIRYRLGSALSYNPSLQFAVLGGLTCALVLAGAIAYRAARPHVSMRTSLWKSWSVLTNTSYSESERNRSALFALTLLAICHYLVFSLVVSVVEESVVERVNSFNAATTNRVLEHGHILVLALGQNPKTVDVVEQLAMACIVRGQSKRKVVLLTNPQTANDVKAHLSLTPSTDTSHVTNTPFIAEPLVSTTGQRRHVIVRVGDPTSLAALSRVSVQHARAVIVLASYDTGVGDAMSDCLVARSVLAIRELAPTDISTSPVRVVAEVRAQRGAASLHAIDPTHTTALDWRDAMASVSAHAALSPADGCATLLDVFSFTTRENVYILPPLDRRHSLTVCEARRRLPRAVVLGYVRGAGSNAQAVLNPSPHHALQPHDRLIVLAIRRSDAAFRAAAPPAPSPTPSVTPPQPAPAPQAQPSATVVVGVRRGIGALLAQLDAASARGSRVVVLSSLAPRAARRAIARDAPSRMRNLRVAVVRGDATNAATMRAALRRASRVRNPSVMILLNDSVAGEDSRAADSRALAVAAVARTLAPAHIVVELVSSAAQPLAAGRVAGATAFARVALLAQLLAHAADDPDMVHVWRALVAPRDGAPAALSLRDPAHLDAVFAHAAADASHHDMSVPYAALERAVTDTGATLVGWTDKSRALHLRAKSLRRTDVSALLVLAPRAPRVTPRPLVGLVE